MYFTCQLCNIKEIVNLNSVYIAYVINSRLKQLPSSCAVDIN